MDVWVNGEKVETENNFVADGTEINFPLADNTGATLKANAADKKKGVIHHLYVDGKLFEEDIIVI